MFGSFCSKTCVRQRYAISASESIISSTLCRARSSTEVSKRRGERTNKRRNDQIVLVKTSCEKRRWSNKSQENRFLCRSFFLLFRNLTKRRRKRWSIYFYPIYSNKRHVVLSLSMIYGFGNAWQRKTRNLISCFLSNQDNYQGEIHLRWRSDLQHPSNNLHSSFSRFLFFGCLEETSNPNTWLVLDRFLSLLFHSW